MRIREIAQARVRYGYRKIRGLLNREGWNVGKYLVCRLYKEEGMTLKKMRPQRKRKAIKHRKSGSRQRDPTRRGVSTSSRTNYRTGDASVHYGVVDIFTREGVAIEVGQSLKGDDVVRTLNRSKSKRGVPKIQGGNVLFAGDTLLYDNRLWRPEDGIRAKWAVPRLFTKTRQIPCQSRWSISMGRTTAWSWSHFTGSSLRSDCGSSFCDFNLPHPYVRQAVSLRWDSTRSPR